MDTNKNIGKDFLDMPKPHHHVSRLLVLLIILGVIAAASACGYYFFNTYSQRQMYAAPVAVDAHAQYIAEQVAKGDMLLGNMKSASAMTPDEYKAFMAAAAKSLKNKPASQNISMESADAILGTLKK